VNEFDDQPQVPPVSPPSGDTPVPAPPAQWASAPAPALEPPPVSEDTDPSAESIDDPVAGDPFEGWPAAQSAAVIEDAPPDGASVEHVRGEVDVPDG